MEKKYLTVKEAAAYTGYSIGYLYALVQKGAIPFYTPNGGRIIFKCAELDNWIERKAPGNNPKNEYLVIR